MIRFEELNIGLRDFTLGQIGYQNGYITLLDSKFLLNAASDPLIITFIKSSNGEIAFIEFSQKIEPASDYNITVLQHAVKFSDYSNFFSDQNYNSLQFRRGNGQYHHVEKVYLRSELDTTTENYYNNGLIIVFTDSGSLIIEPNDLENGYSIASITNLDEIFN